MSNENKELIRRYFEAANNEGPRAHERFLAPEWIGWDSRDGSKQGVEQTKQEHEIILSGLPDARLDVEDQVAEGDKVVTRFRASGTHSKEYFGLPPTGKRVSIAMIEIDRVANGKIVESWLESSGLGFYFQLTGKPSPTKQPAATG